MIRFVVLARNKMSSKALERQLESRLEGYVERYTIFANEAGIASWSVTDEFNRIADIIEGTLCKDNDFAALREAVIVTDIAPFHFGLGTGLNPLKVDGDGLARVLSMLVLAFPEVQWIAPADVCAGSAGGDVTEDSFFLRAHTFTNAGTICDAIDLRREGFVPLLDATGLRSRVRQLIVNDRESGHNGVPVRRQQCFSIDEERSYAYLHAYTAYRFGFRSHIVSTQQMMERLFADGSAVDLGSDYILFEDVFLKFAEARGGRHLSRLQERDSTFPRLKRAACRILVTAGHTRENDQKVLRENLHYLEQFRARQHSDILFKPLGGVFDLWDRSGLDGLSPVTREHGQAWNFVWPPDHNEQATDGGHSAPGRLLEIAHRLADRAERLLPEARSVADFVQGAVLATDALELLAERTPTSALAALVLKHRFEVLAECEFCGVQSNLDVCKRIKDIQREVESLAYWFGENSEKFNAWNEESAILNDLILVYRDRNRFDEEMDALKRSRSLHRRLWYQRPKNLWAKPFQPIAWYVDFLLGSIPRFIAAIVGWILVLSVAYYLAGPLAAGENIMPHATPVRASVLAAYYSFFGIQPPPDGLGHFYAGVTLLAIFGGFVHLGVFISHLYSIVSRK